MTADRRGIADFEGTWRIDRQIADLRAGQRGRFEGTARLVPGPRGRWTWQESGTIRLGTGAPMPAERRYLWQPRDGTIEVLFEDGRFFHAFDPSAAGPEARHDCAPDLYHVRYDFTGWPAWRATWQVEGPRKAYRMESLHRRGDGPG